MNVLALALLIVAHAGAGSPSEGKPASPSSVAHPTVEQRALEVKLAGATLAKWTAKDVATWTALPQAQLQGGKAKQYALADRLPVGTRLAAVIVSTGQRVVIDDKWMNAGQAVLWQNRRGMFKLGWIDAKGAAVANVPELRDVVQLELAPIVVAAPAP